MSEKTILRLLNVCAKAITRTDSTMSYDRTVEAIIRLAEVVHESETDETTWYSEAHGVYLDALIVGAYWFCCDHHGGQFTPEYKALSVLSQIYSPGCAECGSEPESSAGDVYRDLETLKG